MKKIFHMNFLRDCMNFKLHFLKYFDTIELTINRNDMEQIGGYFIE
jgi:hypothetical protein